MKFLDESIHASKPQKTVPNSEQSPCPEPFSLHRHLGVLRAGSLYHLSLLLPQELLWPALQRQKVPALPLLGPLVWASSGCEVSRHVTRRVSDGALLPELLQPWPKRTQQEHITGSREAIRKGLFFSQGAGCQISSPAVWGLTLTKQFFQWNHLWSRVLKDLVPSLCAHSHPPTHL